MSRGALESSAARFSRFPEPVLASGATTEGYSRAAVPRAARPISGRPQTPSMPGARVARTRHDASRAVGSPAIWPRASIGSTSWRSTGRVAWIYHLVRDPYDDRARRPRRVALLTRSVAPSGPRVALACLAAACLVLVIGSTPAKASTTYVDGISDQNLAYWWGTGFYSMFSDAWVGEPAAHIKLARYVGQWNDPADFRLWLERVPPGLGDRRRADRIPQAV